MIMMPYNCSSHRCSSQAARTSGTPHGVAPTFIELVRTSTGIDPNWDVCLTAGDDIDQMPADDGVIGSAGG
jgi:hypothetical protein